MTQNLFLLILLAMGIIGQNSLVSIASAALLLLRLLNLQQVLPYLEGLGLQFGLTLLILSIVSPFASEDMIVADAFKSILRPTGAVTFLCGIIGACLGAQGVQILQSRPEAILGLVLGTIVGATFFRGIPVGPLVAAGMAAVLLQLFGLQN